MRNIFVTSVFFCIFAVLAPAQTLDPTVEVSREYEGQLVEVHKPALTMAVPDSVTRFELDFDYSVFNKPYKGSYEFKPYLLSMKPSASDNGENSFYLRAGAGYQLYPTLDLVWSPKLGKQRNFNLDVYASHRSFVGNYNTILPQYTDGVDVIMTGIPKDELGNHKWFGYDLLSKAGISTRTDFEKLSFDFSAGYYGIVQKDRNWCRDYNALDAKFGLTTKPAHVGDWVFGMDVDYRYAQDRVAGSELNENVLGVDFRVGPFFKGNHHLSVDLGTDLAMYSGAFSTAAGEVHLVPRYIFHYNRLNLNVGVRVSKLLRNGGNDMYGSVEQYVYPDVNFSYAIIPSSLRAYVRVGGGNRLDTYSSVLNINRHITHLPSQLDLDFAVERVNTVFGFDGKITDKFSYNLNCGYVYYANRLVYGLSVSENPLLSIEYGARQKCFASLDWALNLSWLRFDGKVTYNYYSIPKGEELSLRDGITALKPSALEGNVALEYNWKRRIMAGVDCNFLSSTAGPFGYIAPGADQMVKRNAVVPGFVDLGISAEYATAGNVSYWLRVGNLLNMNIQRSPLYAERGVNCTVGICLNL